MIFFLLCSPRIDLAQVPQILLLQIVLTQIGRLIQRHSYKEDPGISGDVFYLPRIRLCEVVSCAHKARLVHTPQVTVKQAITWLLNVFKNETFVF